MGSSWDCPSSRIGSGPFKGVFLKGSRSSARAGEYMAKTRARTLDTRKTAQTKPNKCTIFAGDPSGSCISEIIEIFNRLRIVGRKFAVCLSGSDI
jgi:hypothetical protein